MTAKVMSAAVTANASGTVIFRIGTSLSRVGGHEYSIPDFLCFLCLLWLFSPSPMITLFLALLLQGAGPADKQIVDAAAAERGKATYIAECITCHGAKARGTEYAPDLVRSVVVLRDRVGSEIGPLLRKGHPTQSNKPSASFT